MSTIAFLRLVFDVLGISLYMCMKELNFRNWMEAFVSSENLQEAMKKTLEMRVSGDWKFEFPRETTRQESIKITGSLANEKTNNGSSFSLSCYAIKERPLFGYDSLAGGDDLRITASMIYLDGKGGYSKLGERSSEYSGASPKSNYGEPLKSPFWLADWVNHVVAGFEGFGDGGDDEPEHSPSWGPASLVGV
jgi:hypothetical protein